MLNQHGGLSLRKLFTAAAVIIVVGGFALALLTNENTPTGASFGAAANRAAAVPSFGLFGSFTAANNGQPYPITTVIQTTMMSTTTSVTSEGTVNGGTPPDDQLATGPSANVSQGKGSFIEFSSNVAIQSADPPQMAGRIVLLAYSIGGYVAYQSTVRDSAYVVIRVPAASYQTVLSQIQTMGNVTSLTSNSNDATVQYTDLNATLKSLETEQAALLRLVNQSSSINSTLAIESQLQGVDQQINTVQSQILQTKTLIQFSTISVSVSEGAKQTPLSVTLSATPKSGVSPLSVTLNAIVKGGVGPYLVNCNFGDGSAEQGQIVVHYFVGSGDYNVTVSTTDQNGTVAMAWAMVHVAAQPSQFGLGDFPGTVAGLFVRVFEGIIEVAVVVVPLALVAAVVLVPLRRWNRSQKQIKQNQ